MGMVVVRHLRLRELVPEVGERVEDLRDGDALALPFERARGRRVRVHGLCHSLPSPSSNLAAACGPHVPAAYICRGGRPSRHAAPVGTPTAHPPPPPPAPVTSLGSPPIHNTTTPP